MTEAGVARLTRLLQGYVHESVARGIINHALRRVGKNETCLNEHSLPPVLIQALQRGADLFIDDKTRCEECKKKLLELQNGGNGHGHVHARPSPVYGGPAERSVIPVEAEDDIVVARGKARQVAEELGFSKTDQIKIATAVSELARNIYKYVGRGSMVIEPVAAPRRGIRIVAEDKGPGITNLEEILSGRYRSKSGLGLGLLGCKKLMDEFKINTGPGLGTTITLMKAVA